MCEGYNATSVKEAAGEMASHTCVCHAGEQDVPTCLHVDEPKALGGLADQWVPAAEAGDSHLPSFRGGKVCTGYFEVFVVSRVSSRMQAKVISLSKTCVFIFCVVS